MHHISKFMLMVAVFSSVDVFAFRGPFQRLRMRRMELRGGCQGGGCGRGGNVAEIGGCGAGGCGTREPVGFLNDVFQEAESGRLNDTRLTSARPTRAIQWDPRLGSFVEDNGERVRVVVGRNGQLLMERSVPRTCGRGGCSGGGVSFESVPDDVAADLFRSYVLADFRSRKGTGETWSIDSPQNRAARRMVDFYSRVKGNDPRFNTRAVVGEWVRNKPAGPAPEQVASVVPANPQAPAPERTADVAAPPSKRTSHGDGASAQGVGGNDVNASGRPYAPPLSSSEKFKLWETEFEKKASVSSWEKFREPLNNKELPDGKFKTFKAIVNGKEAQVPLSIFEENLRCVQLKDENGNERSEVDIRVVRFAGKASDDSPNWCHRMAIVPTVQENNEVMAIIGDKRLKISDSEFLDKAFEASMLVEQRKDFYGYFLPSADSQGVFNPTNPQLPYDEVQLKWLATGDIVVRYVNHLKTGTKTGTEEIFQCKKSPVAVQKIANP